MLRRLETLSAVSITASGARGTISGPLEFDTLVIDHEAVRIDARELRLQPELSNLLSRTISIASAEAGTLEVTLRRRGPQPPSEPHFMPHPLRLLVGRFDLRRVALVLTNGQRYSVASINGALTMDHWVLRAPVVTIKDAAGELAGEVRLRAGRPMGVTGTLSGRWRLPDGHDYRFSSAVRGNLDRLGTDIRLVQPARLSFSGNALDLTARAAVGRDAPCHRIRRLTLGSRGALPARERLDRDQRGAQLDRSRRHAHLDRARRRAAASAGRWNMAGPCHRDHHASRMAAAQRARRSPRPGRSISRPNHRCSRSAASGRRCAGRSRASRSSQAPPAPTASAGVSRTPTR